MITTYEKKNISWLLWIPCIWMVLSIARAGLNINAMQSLSDADSVEGNAVLRNLLSALMLTGFAGLTQRDIKWSKVFKENIWIFLIFAYMGISSLWAAYTVISFKRWVKTIGGLIMVFVVLSEKDPLLAISTLLRRALSFLLISSFVLIKFFPYYGIQTSEGYPSWVGLTSTKNNLGQLAVIGAIYFLWSFRNKYVRKKTDIGFILLSLYLLAGSKSTTSLFIFGIAAFLFFLFEIKNLNKQHITAILIFCAIFCGVTFYSLDTIFYNGNLVPLIIKSSGKDMTFTGRTDLWKDILDLGAKRPLTGYGYGSFWTGRTLDEIWEKYVWLPNQAHNGYIDIYINLGISGLALVAFMILGVFKNISNQFVSNYEYAKMRMIFFITILVFNFMESSLCRLIHFLWLMFLLIAVSPLYFVKLDQ